MKGEKVVTNLVPYGPEMPVGGMQKTANTDQASFLTEKHRSRNGEGCCFFFTTAPSVVVFTVTGVLVLVVAVVRMHNFVSLRRFLNNFFFSPS